MTKQPWEMTKAEYEAEHIRLYETLGNAVYGTLPFCRYQSEAAFYIHNGVITAAYKGLDKGHVTCILRALSEGKQVPVNVLAEFPNLVIPKPEDDKFPPSQNQLKKWQNSATYKRQQQGIYRGD